MDDPEYAEKALKKLTNYAKSEIFLGVNLVITYETSQTPLDTQLLEKLIKKFCL